MNRAFLPLLSLIALSHVLPLQAGDLTPKVKALFESQCKECHHPDTNDDFPYLHEGFDLAELIGEEMITEGDPEESAIFRRVSMDPTSKKRMPKSSGAEGDDTFKEPLSPDEQGLIRDWIVQLGSATPAPEKPMTEEKKDDAPAPAPAVTATVADSVDAMPANLDLNGQVHRIFATRCGQCHEGDYEPELHGTVSLGNFFTERDDSGTILLAEAVLDRVERANDDSERMPKSKGAEGEKGFRPPLTEAETAVLKQWVAAGKPKEVKREFISQSEVLKTILDDLTATSETQRTFFRYLTLTNLYNQTDAGGAAIIPDLDPHRAAIGKLINSLSTNAKITVPKAIDEAGTIYRIDLRDYNWNRDQWDQIVSFYPYGIIGIDGQKENLIAKHSGSTMAYLRADWFTFAASQPPLYDRILDELLGIDPTQEGGDVHIQLDAALGVDRLENLREGRAMRAGFQYSGVSGANRLIERHELGSHQGAYWVSYDFTPLSAERTHDLTLAPLGPVGAGLTDDDDHMFHHDGGEMIYHLPNGLQGYMLTTQDGKRLDRAPIEIVQDDNRQDKVIINGISCMACHDKGMKPPIKVTDLSKRTLATMEDEVRPLVEAAGILNFEESNLLRKLYPEPAVLQAAVKEDFERFTKAEMEATGGLSGASEPVLGLYKEFRGAVTARKLAAEFGLEYEELLTLLKEESDSSEVLSIISSSMERDLSVRRENLLREYLSVVYALGYELMPFTPLGYEEFGGQKYADLVANSDQYLAAFGTGGQTISQTKLAVSGSAGASEALATESVLMHGGGKLRLSIQPKLTVGERANLEIVATDDAHIRVFHLSSDQHVTELFPGSTKKDTFRPKNKKLTVSWETTAPGGPEHVVVFAAKTELTNVARGQVAGDFTVYEKDKIFSARGIPKAVRATEETADSAVPAQVTEARIGYFLKD